MDDFLNIDFNKLNIRVTRTVRGSAGHRGSSRLGEWTTTKSQRWNHSIGEKLKVYRTEIGEGVADRVAHDRWAILSPARNAGREGLSRIGVEAALTAVRRHRRSIDTRSAWIHSRSKTSTRAGGRLLQTIRLDSRRNRGNKRVRVPRRS